MLQNLLSAFIRTTDLKVSYGGDKFYKRVDILKLYFTLYAIKDLFFTPHNEINFSVSSFEKVIFNLYSTSSQQQQLRPPFWRKEALLSSPYSVKICHNKPFLLISATIVATF